MTKITASLATIVRESGWVQCAKEEPGAQFLPQDYGFGYHKPNTEMVLKDMLSMIEHDVGKMEESYRVEVDELKTKLSTLNTQLLEGSTNPYAELVAKLTKNLEVFELAHKEALERENNLLLVIKSQQEKIEIYETKIARGDYLGPKQPTYIVANSETGAITAQSTAPASGTPVLNPMMNRADEHNGIARPGRGATHSTWEIADRLRVELGKPPTRTELVAAVKAEKPDIKEGTAAAAYSNWCRYNGLDAKDPSKPWVDKEKAITVVAQTGVEAVEVPIVRVPSLPPTEVTPSGVPVPGSVVYATPPLPTIPPFTRYFIHPESSCYFTTSDGSHPGTDGCVEEVDEEEFEKFVAQVKAVTPPLPVVAAPQLPPLPPSTEAAQAMTQIANEVMSKAAKVIQSLPPLPPYPLPPLPTVIVLPPTLPPPLP